MISLEQKKWMFLADEEGEDTLCGNPRSVVRNKPSESLESKIPLKLLARVNSKIQMF